MNTFNEPRTYLPAKAERYAAMAGTLFFALLVAASFSLLWVELPKKPGSDCEGNAIVPVVLGVSLFGTMLLCAIWSWLNSYVEHFTVAGSMLTVWSLFRERQFDVSELKIQVRLDRLPHPRRQSTVGAWPLQ